MFSVASPSAPGSKQQCSAALLSKLAKVLPKGHKFTINHLSTPPTRTDALYSAPPDARPDRTYRESHFLAVSVDATAKLAGSSSPSSPLTPGAAHDSGAAGRQVLVLGLEIYIFTTAWASTFFVSKADSTGYLSLLNLPKGTPSPIREISSAFISYLVEQRRRNNVQTIVSLFARAQNQYLFPGSVENKDKHVLDDRGLVRWWCRVLNSMMETQNTHEDKIFRPSNKGGNWEDIGAYLVVPGLDAYELRAFLPRTTTSSNWVLGHPLERISHFAREYDWVPPRCLVPKFPDDPKSRFRDELDLEASKSAQYEEKGLWRSATTMDQFWEMMAFRQECSSGHMTGFIWVVLEPYGWAEENTIAASSPTNSLVTPSASFDGSQATQPSTPPRRRDVLLGSTPKTTSPLKSAMTPGSTQQTPTKQSPSKSKAGAKAPKPVLKGRIIPRIPRVKRHARNYVPDIPISTSYYYWPPEGRGTRIAAEADYKRSVDLLTKLDFETLELASASTRRWINEVGGGQKWAMDVVGRRPMTAAPNVTASTAINIMANLVRKKGRAAADSGPSEDDSGLGSGSGSASSASAQAEATMLTARKKPKKDTTPPTTSGEDAAASSVNLLVPRKKRKESASEDSGTVGDGAEAKGVNAASATSETPAINTLGGGLVRKKPKTA